MHINKWKKKRKGKISRVGQLLVLNNEYLIGLIIVYIDNTQNTNMNDWINYCNDKVTKSITLKIIEFNPL